jgi:hypothetical protein
MLANTATAPIAAHPKVSIHRSNPAIRTAAAVTRTHATTPRSSAAIETMAPVTGP